MRTDTLGPMTTDDIIAERKRLNSEIERLQAAQRDLLHLIDQNCHRGLVESAERIVRLAGVYEQNAVKKSCPICGAADGHAGNCI